MPTDNAIAEELRGVLFDFYGAYRADGGDASLIARLIAQWEQPQRGDGPSVRSVPHSHAPGDDHALVLAEEVRQAVLYWAARTHPATCAVSLKVGLDLLPDLAASHRLGPEVLADFRSLRGQALICLGFEPAPVPIRVPGVVCGACGRPTLVYSKKTGLIWCSDGGPEGCHDDATHPHCRAVCQGCGVMRDPRCEVCAGQLPLVECRQNHRSTRHAWKVPFDRLHDLLARSHTEPLAPADVLRRAR
ncbi:MAG: hypothetical protein IRZ28_22430 [Steroidobacteraceae bacterium]|nr:hypothetical protein [Steroidobacteraceae bacterium]